jgi:hypothetical protein
MRQKGQYIIRRPGSPFFYVQLPGRPAKSTKIRAEGPGLDGKQIRDNERVAERIRDLAVAGHAETLTLLGLDRESEKAVKQGPTLGEWIASWRIHFAVNHKLSTRDGSASRLRYWERLWGARVLADLTVEDVLRWRAKFLAGDETLTARHDAHRQKKITQLSNSHGNINSMLATLRMVLGNALKARAIRGEDGRWEYGDGPGAVYWLPDPRDSSRPSVTHFCMGFKKLKVPGIAKGKHITVEQFEALRKVADQEGPEMYALFLLGSRTGQRLQSLLELKRSDVIPYVGRADVKATVAFPDPKNGEPHMMALGDDVDRALKAIPVDPDNPEQFFARTLTTESPRGNVRKWLIRTCKRADVPYMRWHWVTRATAAMRLHTQGCTSFEIMQVLNWKSEAMVRRYVPTMPASLLEKGARILAGLSPEVPQRRKRGFANNLQIVSDHANSLGKTTRR